MLPPVFTATNLFPSADEAIESHKFVGALVCVQIWAGAKLVTSNTETINKIVLMVFIACSLTKPPNLKTSSRM
jgi:hypothetical protein